MEGVCEGERVLRGRLHGELRDSSRKAFHDVLSSGDLAFLFLFPPFYLLWLENAFKKE